MTADPAALPPLDWRTMPLDGRVLIEASAGTGKTYNIGLIYLRLLLERELGVEHILVTTFTNPAAEELCERIRLRLIEAERLLLEQRETGAIAGSAVVDSLEAHIADLCTDAERGAQLLRRIQLARADFDRAPISTIHGFCQRVLRDHPFASGSLFQPGELGDEGELLREVFEDFWRQSFQRADVDLVPAQRILGGGLEEHFRTVRSMFAAAGARIATPGDSAPALLGALATLDDPAQFQQPLQALLADDKAIAWHGNKKRARRLIEALAGAESARGALLDLHPDDLCVLTTEKLAQLQVKAKTLELSDQPCMQLLGLVADQLPDEQAKPLGRFLGAAYAFCRDELPRRAAARNLLSFSMLIDRVHDSLMGQGGEMLAQQLREAYPVALIDEFQDTDQRQFAIFDRIYAETGTLVMIGDPKQAIYGFRGGDIAAYLRASLSTPRRYSLATNFRSASAYVGALNALYALTDGGFGPSGIHYQPVQASTRADAKPYRIDGNPVATPLLLHRFRPEPDGEGDKPIDSLTALEALALRDCANRIAELLDDPSHTIDGARVQPGDIAVLLPNNAQIRSLRALLTERGVPCVGSGRGSVLATDWARDLDLLLYAVLHPADDAAVRGALATALLGCNFATLRALQDNTAAFEARLAEFEQWRSLWRSRGILALIEALVAPRAGALLAGPDGERVLTDLRHLGELLAEQESELYGPEELHAWFARLRHEAGADDGAEERQLRIESEARRVQLVTLHASKGLEYPIVFLPLLWRISSRGGQYQPQAPRFHDKHGQLCIDVGSTAFADNLEQHFEEDLQERLRQLYVALTRARHACHVHWVDRGRRRGAAHTWEIGAVDALLLEAMQRLELTPGEAALTPLAAAIGAAGVVEAYPAERAQYRAPRLAPAPRAAEADLPAVRSFHWQHSFSSLVRRAALATATDGGAEDEGDVAPTASAPNAEEEADDARLLALYPLRGPQFGDAVHAIFEEAAPGALWPAQRKLVEAKLDAHAVRAFGEFNGDGAALVGALVDRVRAENLGDGLRLAALDSDARVLEFEFLFPVQHGSLAQLRRLCCAHGEPELVPAALGNGVLHGMMKGFIDLVFAWDGRYHVLDYKTNWEGAKLGGYRQFALAAAMDRHHYRLQALLYSVALHRYLRQRIADYDPDRHLGDSWYLFLRAVGLAPGAGIWRQRWPRALIEAVDRAFGGAWEQAA